MNHQGQPPHPGVPQQQHPALAGQPPQAQQPQPQPPQQGQGFSNLVDPGQRPVAPYGFGEYSLTPDGPKLPFPLPPDGVLDGRIAFQMHRMGGTEGIQPHAAMIGFETWRAFGFRDQETAWLKRRISDIEKKMGIEPISMDQCMKELQAEMMEAMAKAEAEQAQQEQSAPGPQMPMPQQPMGGAAPQQQNGGGQ